MLKTFSPQSPDDFWPFARQPEAGTSATLIERLAAGLRALAWLLIERYRLMQARNDLAALDDRMLKDIGIERSQIGRVVRYGRLE
jgi:uncharacterized protein YjiS (DUF1127 family)